MINKKFAPAFTFSGFFLTLCLLSFILACPQKTENQDNENNIVKNNFLDENRKTPLIPPELVYIPALPKNVDTNKLKLEQERYGIEVYKQDSSASIEGNNLVLSAKTGKPSWAIYAIDKVDQTKPASLYTWKVKATGGPFFVGLSTYAKGGWTILGPFSIWNIGGFTPSERYSGPDGIAFLMVITPSSKTVIEGIEITTQSNPAKSVIKPIQRRLSWNQIDGFFEDDIDETWTREVISLIDFTSKDAKPYNDVEIRYQVNQSNNYLYFAVEWPDPLLNDKLSKDKDMNFDATSIYLCPASHSSPEENDDIRTLSPAFRTTYLDQHFDQDENSADDACMDGIGWCTYDADAMLHRAEFVVPMVGDGKQDLQIDPQNPGEILVQMQFINGFHILDKKNAAMKVGYMRAGEAKTTNGWLKVKPEPFNNPAEFSRFKGNLVYISDEPQTIGELFKLELPVGKISQLTKNDLFEDNVSISPNGSWCAFSIAKNSGDLKSYEIARINLDGSGFKELTKNELNDDHSAISPDGKTIAFARYNREKAADVFLIPADGGTARQITDSELDINDPEWFADGKRLIVKTHDPKLPDAFDVIQILNIADGQLTEQITVEKNKANDHNPSVSPDGAQVAFMRFMEQKDWTKHMLEAPWQIFYSRFGESENQQVTDYLGINQLPVWVNNDELLFLRAIGPGYKQLWLTTKNGLQQNEFIHTLPRLRSFDYKPILEVTK